ncbi:hypothetical protein L0E83_11335 [Marichromatium gracile]|uniref:hypothetical protein n=1 Tax=Marichromatium gracile TaxID=1048 RepID=UPI001F1A1B50|nr:hypothetical protein [Marichromatium gracile]MCF1184023.1 hypothetical protein [Marichromatium gracile]
MRWRNRLGQRRCAQSPTRREPAARGGTSRQMTSQPVVDTARALALGGASLPSGKEPAGPAATTPPSPSSSTAEAPPRHHRARAASVRSATVLDGGRSGAADLELLNQIADPLARKE